jgi:hypothetical protein
MKALKSKFVQEVLDISEYSVKFNVPRFIKMLIYHLLNFMIGPLLIPIILVIDTVGLAKNMSFIYSAETKAPFIL